MASPFVDGRELGEAGTATARRKSDDPGPPQQRSCPIERSNTDTRGHSRDLCQGDDLHERWSGKVQSQPSKLVVSVLFADRWSWLSPPSQGQAR